MSEDRAPIRLVAETAETVTLRRTDFDGLLEELEDAEDRIAVLEHDLEVAKGDHTPALTKEEVERLLTGENRVKFWRQKQTTLSQRHFAEYAGISQSLLAEIESGTKRGSIETLKKIAKELKISVDALLD
jgi:DNA-binding XRE family transcriptional regulator